MPSWTVNASWHCQPGQVELDAIMPHGDTQCGAAALQKSADSAEVLYIMRTGGRLALLPLRQ
jgi:hypothetical protein